MIDGGGGGALLDRPQLLDEVRLKIVNERVIMQD